MTDREQTEGESVGGVEFGARMTVCKCGHPAVEHYDSYLLCTWSVGDDATCDCDEFTPAGPEVWVKVG